MGERANMAWLLADVNGHQSQRRFDRKHDLTLAYINSRPPNASKQNTEDFRDIRRYASWGVILTLLELSCQRAWDDRPEH